jgi:predicted GNAT family N-acyltransferase
MNANQHRPLFVSKASARSLWQEYRMYPDRLELKFWIFLTTLKIPAEKIVDLKVVSPIYDHSMEPGEKVGVIDLVSKVFDEFVAPLYSQEGVSEFMKYLRVDDLTERLKAGNFVLLVKSGSDIIGVVEVRENSHIALLFVEGSHQKNGTGKGLLKMAIETCQTRNPDTRRINVNSFPNAVTANQNMGFNATKQEQVVNGICFIPMELSLI